MGAGCSASRAAKKSPPGLFSRRNASAGPQLFESTREGGTLVFLQKKKTSVFSTLVFLVGAGVSASRAAKKSPPGLFSRRNASAGPQLFESTREGVSWGFCKRKRPAYFLHWSFWWARVDSNKPHSLLWLLACAQSNGFMPLFGLPPERPLHQHARRCA